MRIDKDEIKSKTSIYDVLSKYSIQIDRTGMCVCPFHRDNDASLKIYNNNTFHCFGCGADGDAIEFVEKMENCDFFKACEIIAGENFSRYEHQAPIKTTNYKPDKDRIKRFVLYCHKNIGKTNYFAKRHLTSETIRRFTLGYDAKHNAVIIPYNRRLSYYQSRNIDTKKFYKPNVDLAGKEPLFNVEVLKTKNIVFVVESPICAMSIMQCGFNAIATCGTQGWKKVPIAELDPDCKLVLCFDNDIEGQKAQKLLIDALPSKCFEFNVAGDCKDPNELLMKDGEKLKENLNNAIVYVKNNLKEV